MSTTTAANTALPKSVSSTLKPVLAKLAKEAVAVDSESAYPGRIMRELGEAGAFAGLAEENADLHTPIAATASVARLCAATSFCSWCQGALTWYLRSTSNSELRHAYLPKLASGRLLGGTALSNPMKAAAGLERLMLSGKRLSDGGWEVSGAIPWISNIESGHKFGAIFATEDGPPIMALFDAVMPGLSLRPNDNFEVMGGTATVVARFMQVRISIDEVLAFDADEFINKIRPGFVLLQAGIGLGLLHAASDVMRSSGRAASGGLPGSLLATPGQVDELRGALAEQVKEQANQISAGIPPSMQETMSLRLSLAEAVIQAATAAQLMAGAPGLIKGRRAARLLREASFYGVLTPSVRQLSYLLAKN